jgi:hypothetical protein
MKRFARGCSAAMVLGVATLVLAGCETGRVNKLHAGFEHANDVATTGHPSADANQTAALGQPPVPGSPTAAGQDGRQPLLDSDARRSPGEEAIAASPERQAYRFTKQ